jgi:hypothetical protein
MSVIYLGEKFNRPATEQDGRVKTTRVFQVKTTNNESGVEVLKAAGLPVRNDPLDDSNPDLLCKNRTANVEVEKDTWLVTCSYEPSSTTYTTEPGEGKPWELPPYNVSYGTVVYNQVLENAYDEADPKSNPTIPVLNSVGDSFDPPLQYNQYNSLLKFSYNKRHFNLFDVKVYQGTLNEIKLTVLGYELDSGEGLITNLNANKIDVKDEDGDFQYSYYQINVEIELASYSWEKKILDAGFYYLDGETRKEIKLSTDGTLGDSGEAVTEPMKLDGAGGILAADAEPHYLSFNKYAFINWKGLGLPQKLEG